MLAHVGPARAALVARPVDEVCLRGHERAHRHTGRALASRHHDAGHLVAEDHGRLDVGLGPRVPSLDVHIGPADARRLDLDEYFTRPRSGIGTSRMAAPGALRSLTRARMVRIGQTQMLGSGLAWSSTAP